MSLLHKKEGPLKLLKNPKSTFYCIWSVFGGVSNLLPISADYSLKSQIGIGKNWVGPPPERAIGYMKRYKIMKRRVYRKLIPYIGQIVFVCAHLTNMLPVKMRELFLSMEKLAEGTTDE